MDAFAQVLLLLLLTTLLSVGARWLPWPAPITYVLGASGVALSGHFPRIELDPDLFFLCFVPPLLFSDGWLMPLRDFLAAKRPILTLSTGLVAFTTIAVGLCAYWLVPGLPLAMGFALGAVVSPTDAVAVSAILQKLKVPARLSAVLNGESLMNDATGLVAFKFALAAVAAGSFSLQSASLQFLLLAIGGIAIGLVLAYLIGKIRDLLRAARGSDAYIELSLSLMTPYAVYLTADVANVSTILAVATAGLYSGWRDPLKMDVETRQTTLTVWAVMLFWLNGLAFVLLGLQMPALLGSLSDRFSMTELALFISATSGVAILSRLIWIFPNAYLPFLIPYVRRSEARPSWQAVTVAGWSGMRGTITLAAALSIPVSLDDGSPFPGRDIVIFLACGIIMVTLLLQGTTLESLICRLGLRPDESLLREEKTARIQAVEAGLVSLRSSEGNPMAPEEAAALDEVIAEYQYRLAELNAEGETGENARHRRRAALQHRLAALAAERATLNVLWRKDAIADEIHHSLIHLLDHEQALLDGLLNRKP